MTTRTCIELILAIMTIGYILGATAVGRANAILVNAMLAIASVVTLFVYAID